MSKEKEYELYLENLQACAIKEYRKSYEYELSNYLQSDFDEILFTNLTAEQKTLVEEILFKTLSFCERETDFMYRRGIKDGIWMLKTLNIIA